MTDPFGTAAGIVGVIGVAIQIAQLVAQFSMNWKDAPDNVNIFLAELGTLKTVLSETNANILLNPDFEAAFQNRPSVLLSQLGPGVASTTDTKRMLEICRRELESLLNELKKRGQGHRLGWERFKGAFLAKNTLNSVRNLNRQCQTLNRMLSIDAIVIGASTLKEFRDARKEQQEWQQTETGTSLAIKSGIDQSNRWQATQDCQTILDWLTPINHATYQSDFIRLRQEGTGQWLLDSAEFQSWVRNDKQTLFCPGIPGAGKTIITSIVVNELTTHFQGDENIGIAYLYCNFRRHDEQNTDDLLTSLLKQLAEGQPSLPRPVKDLYIRHKTRRTQPSVSEILDALQAVITLYSKVFVVIDALDECQISNSCCQTFLSEIFNLQNKFILNLFATSRFIPEIVEIFSKDTQLEIQASEQDVQRYLDGNMSQLPRFVHRNSDLRDEIKARIIKTVSGMFLLAQLHLDSLKKKKSPKAIRIALEMLPTGSKAYDSAYKGAMERIGRHLEDEERLAKQVLSWITCSKRPLTTSELEHALAVELGASQLDTENICQVEDMVSICAGLVTVDKESKIIRLVHYTTQEYFERTRSQWFPEAEVEITRTCVTYLSFNVFGSGYCLTDDDFEKRFQENKLYDYASDNWGHHARAASTFIPEVKGFLESRAQLEASSQALLANMNWLSERRASQDFPKQITGLHLATYFGVGSVVGPLLANRADVAAADGSGRTPLHWASENGHVDVVKLLLENGAGVAAADISGLTPLHWASKGHVEVVKLLLENGAGVAATDISGRTPLHWASENGHVDVVKLLLENGAGVAAADISGLTPLHWALKYRYTDIVKLLRENGTDIAATNSSG